MKYLVRCVCGHGLDRHDVNGCGGDTRFRSCSCPRDQEAALQTALDEVRTNPETWRSRAEETGSA
jgi:hypothetical protein